MCQGLFGREWERLEDVALDRKPLEPWSFSHAQFVKEQFEKSWVEQHGDNAYERRRAKEEWKKIVAWLNKLLTARNAMVVVDKTLGSEDCDAVDLHATVARLSVMADAVNVAFTRVGGAYRASEFKAAVRRIAKDRRNGPKGGGQSMRVEKQ
jgi:hypothetical protein